MRSLDAALAELVYGHDGYANGWSPSTDPAASHQLRTWLRENGWRYMIRAGERKPVVPYAPLKASVESDRTNRTRWGLADDECMALALAAYHALAGKPWEDPSGPDRSEGEEHDA